MLEMEPGQPSLLSEENLQERLKLHSHHEKAVKFVVDSTKKYLVCKLR